VTAKIKKTHAVRMLEAKGIEHRLTVYDPSGAFHSGEEAASLVGAPTDAVYKTLVAVRESPPGKALLVMIPVALELDLKALAREVSAKSLRMATQREAEKLTGMQAGGISALGLQRPGFEVLIDNRARGLDRVHVSAGARGMDVELAVADLVALTGARFVSAAKQAREGAGRSK
jgi:Cys-tRNA(Pro)/Cys-tRNA(Cys) deacylase